MESVFLYHCELWTTTKTINDQIDAFHRRLLRYAIGTRYPHIVSNDTLYDMTKCEPWSKTIKKRRLSWFGHLLRMDDDVPARIALKEALVPSKRKRGRPTTNWLAIIKQDLESMNIKSNLTNPETFKEIETICSDRDEWKARCSMRGNLRVASD